MGTTDAKRESQNHMSYALTVARWISEVSWEQIPFSLQAKAQDHYLDTIGAIIAGANTPATQIANKTFTATGPCRRFLQNDRTLSMVDAARVNAVSAHSLEIDDTEGLDHSGAVVVPVILALSDELPTLSHQQKMEALIVGYEIGRRVQTMLGGYAAHNASGWHSTATCGVFASAATAAKLMKLNAEQTAHCLGIAASLSSGGWAFSASGAMTKQLHPGFAAGNGIIAAQLSIQGATGPIEIFNDVWGSFLTTHGNPDSEAELLTAKLGQDWAFSHSAIKPYAACRSAHSALDALQEAITHGRFKVEDIDGIEILLDPYLLEMIGKLSGTNESQARMSLPISISLLLNGHELMPWDYSADSQARASHWLDKTSVTPAPSLSGQEPILRMRVGQELIDLQQRFARGGEMAPLTREEVIAKFCRLTSRSISTDVQDQIVQSILGYSIGHQNP